MVVIIIVIVIIITITIIIICMNYHYHTIIKFVALLGLVALLRNSWGGLYVCYV